MSIIEELFGVAGKTVLVTGASRGIGEAIAEGFVRAGSRVFICSRNEVDCLATANRLAELGRCEGVAADLASEAGRNKLAVWLRERAEQLDVLVNNAGAIWAAPLDDYPESGWDKVFNLNVKGLFFLIKALVPLLEKAGSHGNPARVINIGSIDGFHVPRHETYAYSSSKAAMHHMSRHLADQLAARHIAVNVIAPGMFPSRMLKGSLARLGEAKLVEAVPLRRLTSEADMAGAALYLASPAASYITGAVIPVDGGTATTL